MDTAKPYIIAGMDFLVEMDPYTSIANVWELGFDRNETVLLKGNSSWPLNDIARMRAAILKFGPERAKDMEVEAYDKTVTTISLFGYAGNMRSSGGEVQSLAALRWQREGTRKVIMANVQQIVEFLQEEAEPLVPHPIPSDVSNCMKFADSVVVSALRARGSMLYHCTIKPQDMVQTPPGWWVLEAYCNMERNFGVHTSLLPKLVSVHAGESFISLASIKLQSLPTGQLRDKTSKHP